MPNLLGSLADGIRDERVNSESCEDQREDGESGEEQSDETARGGVAVDELLESSEFVGGKIWIEGCECRAKCRCQGRGRQAGADDEFNSIQVRTLTHWHVHFVSGAFFERFVACVGDYADDAAPAILIEHLSDCVLAWPQCARQSLIDNYDLLAHGRIVCGEVASEDEGNSGGAEITFGNPTDVNVRILAWRQHLTFADDGPADFAAIEWNGVGNACRTHSGSGARDAQGFVQICIPRRLSGEVLTGVYADRCSALGLEAEGHVEHTQGNFAPEVRCRSAARRQKKFR